MPKVTSRYNAESKYGKFPCRNGPLHLTRHYQLLGINAGTGKTTMLKRLRTLAESRDYRAVGLAPSASAARTLE